MPTWPATLPQYPLLDGYNAGTADSLLAWQVDRGPPKVRRKTTANYTPIQCSWKLTGEQKAILQAFVRNDLAGAALPFDWPNPEDIPNTCSARFAPGRLPSYQAAGARWLVQAEIWILP